MQGKVRQGSNISTLVSWFVQSVSQFCLSVVMTVQDCVCGVCV